MLDVNNIFSNRSGFEKASLLSFSLPESRGVKMNKLKYTILTLITLMFMGISSAYNQNPNWTAPNGGSFTYSASVIGIVKYNGTTSNNLQDRIAFFVGNQIRGLSTPVQVGPNVIHFVTVYSNQVSQSMQVKIYHQATNTVYDVVPPFSFVANQIYGSLNSPMIFNAYTNNNAPLTLNPIPSQQTIQGLAFDTINLTNYLVQPDPYPVVWTYTHNPNLNVSITNGRLFVSPLPAFSGQTTLTVRVTEMGPFPPPQQFAERDITLNITAAYAAPAWNPIPGQGIVIGDTFDNVNLDIYEYQYGGPYLEYNYKPILTLATPPLSPPSWVHPTNFVNSMSITAKATYTPKYQFRHNGDKLAAFVGSQLRGVSNLNVVTGLFFLNIGSNVSSGETIKLVLYSAALDSLIPLVETFPFLSGSIIGTPSNPEIIDFTPILPTINNVGLTSFDIIDTTFIGEMTFEFAAFDSLYQGFLHDETMRKMCIVPTAMDLNTLYLDFDGDGLGNPNIFITACSEGNGYVSNDDDCDDAEPIDFDILVSIIENSAGTSNDGIVCQNTTISITASGGMSYIWSSGQTTSNIAPHIVSDSTFAVTVTFASGCKGRNIADIFTIDGLIVTNSSNAGLATLRGILACANEGDTITYDFPTTNVSQLTEVITIDKNIVIEGLDSNSRPTLSIDFSQPTSGLAILPAKTLTLRNIDIQAINHTTQSLLTNTGTLSVEGLVEIKD